VSARLLDLRLSVSPYQNLVLPVVEDTLSEEIGLQIIFI